MKPRRQDLYRVSLNQNGSGALIRSICCNDYLLPGVLWAYKEQCLGNWHVREEYIGKGRLDSDMRDRPVDLVVPATPDGKSRVTLHYTDGTTKRVAA